MKNLLTSTSTRFVVLFLAAFALERGSSYSVQPLLRHGESHRTGAARPSRRDALLAAATAAIATPFWLLPTSAHAAASLTTFDDPTHGFSIGVPSDWTASTQQLADRRQLKLWTDPADPKTALFIAYTPVRDDFTSLASFGPVDQVAAQTILPKGALAGNTNVQAEMLTAVNTKNAYVFDYTQAIEGVQPPTHFRTIFTLQQGATGGAGAVLVTITAQTPEGGYATQRKELFDAMINSYGKSKS